MKFYTSSDFKRHNTAAANTTNINTSNYNNEPVPVAARSKA